MTLLDLINNLPHWLQIVAYVVLAIWSSEMFLLIFKINLLNSRLKDLIELQSETLDMIKDKNEELNRTYVMLSTVMASLLRREQKEEKEQSNSKDVE